METIRAGNDVTVYVGEMYERTTNTATGAVEHRYFVHSGERVVAVVTRSTAPTSQETTRYLHVDNLGSVETVTDETGSKPAEKRSYDAFGARRNPLEVEGLYLGRIIFWDEHEPKDQNVYPVAKNFTEFIEGLSRDENSAKLHTVS